MACGVAQGVGPEFKPHTEKKKKKKKKCQNVAKFGLRLRWVAVH
jgi:hypothetical protein